MTGGDSYKEFDTSSIITSGTGKDTISVGKYSFRKRDVLLGGIAVLALVLVIILAIVLAVEVGNQSSDCPDSASSSAQTKVDCSVHCPASIMSTTTTTTTTTKPTATPSADACTTAACLRAAAYEKTIMDESTDPCTDFYTFACGKYAEFHPQNEFLRDVTPPEEIYFENQENLIYALDFSVQRDTGPSYERKLKHFMSSCTNHFDKMSLGGWPLIHQVINPFGGWYLFGNFSASTFDLDASLKSVHIDFWTTAFFRMIVNVDSGDWNKRIVELEQGGVGGHYLFFQPPEIQNFWQNLYKNYITHITSLLMADSGIPLNTTMQTIFVDDVYEVEANISKIMKNTPVQEDPHLEENKRTLAQLNSDVQNKIDFVDYFKRVFSTTPNSWTSTTTVAVLGEGYFVSLGKLLSEYLGTDAGKRKLHNYLIWQLISRYAQDLSWNYVHARRQLDYYISGSKDSSSGYGYCFSLASSAMTDALGAYYLKHHLRPSDKQEGIDMLNHVKEELISGIKKLPWMTSEDRTTAENKIRNSLYKIGYPDYMEDDNYMDSMYAQVNISDTDYFGNILNLNKVYKKLFNDLMANQASKLQWAYHVFQPAVEYYNPWHELIATAAVLQTPLFAYDGPKYLNYGGVGTLLAKYLIHAIDQYGSQYKTDHSGFGNWWANFTATEYGKLKQCAVEAQANEKLGPFKDFYDDTEYTPDIKVYASSHAPLLLADSSGLRLAYRSYKKKHNEMTDPIPAGFPGRTADQMFFVAYAQAYCQNTPDYLKESQLIMSHKYPSKNKINLAVSHVPEFHKAFNCKPGALLVPSQTCSLFSLDSQWRR